MFAVPNDIALFPIQVLPIADGGLLAEATCIKGDKKWPVLTIVHASRIDHDYTNTAGQSVQLPLFFLMDFGCSMINLFISFQLGIVTIQAVLQIFGSLLFTIYKIRI